MSKGTGISSLLIAAAGALGLVVLSDTYEEAQTQTENPVTNTASSENESTPYTPSIPLVAPRNSQNGSTANSIKVVQSKDFNRIIEAGDSFSGLGISKMPGGGPRMGPGAFAYLKTRNAYAVLDSQRSEQPRIILYHKDPSKDISLMLPRESVPLGLTATEDGDLLLLTRSPHPSDGKKYPTLWRLDSASDASEWLKSRDKAQPFTISNFATHNSVMALEMIPRKQDLILKGLELNEWHVLPASKAKTLPSTGFPLDNGNRLQVSETSPSLVLETINSSGVLHRVETHEDPTRLRNYRALADDLVSLDLDPSQSSPREFLIVNTTSGEILLRSPLKERNLEMDIDLFLQGASLHQVSHHGSASKKGLGIFRFTQTDFEGVSF